MADPEGKGGARVNRWRVAGWSVAALLLVVPAVVMKLTGEGGWSVGDFVFLGVLLAGTGAALELAARKTGSAAYRTGVGLALAATLLMIWVNGAIGIIGSEDNDANLIYYGVLAVALVGSLIARFRPQGMAHAMTATAVAQGLAFVVAWAAGWGFTGPITLLFLAFWLGAARLFGRAGGEAAA